MSEFSFDSESPEIRERAANAVYDSITMLELIANGELFSGFSEERAKQRKDMYDSNLNFLKKSLTHEYYEGYLDKERVEAGIAAAEANPPEGSNIEG
jgi:hypothetical protein